MFGKRSLILFIVLLFNPSRAQTMNGELPFEVEYLFKLISEGNGSNLKPSIPLNQNQLAIASFTENKDQKIQTVEETIEYEANTDETNDHPVEKSSSTDQDDDCKQIFCLWQGCNDWLFEKDLKEHIEYHLSLIKYVKNTVYCLWIGYNNKQCRRDYTSKSSLKGHIASKHFDKDLYKCSQCAYSCRSENAFKKHKKEKRH